MTERAKVIKIEVPVEKFRRSRKDWNGHCHEDECFNDGQPRECEAPDLCWPNNCCFREGTDRPLIARPTETVLMVPKSDLDSALSRIAELEALASRSEAPAAPKHEGMTIAGDGASMLGTLMREQRASRIGVYPDGNPNAGRSEAPAAAGAAQAAYDSVYRWARMSDQVYATPDQAKAIADKFGAAPASTPPAVAAPAQAVEVSDVINDIILSACESEVADVCDVNAISITVDDLRAILEAHLNDALQASKPEGESA